MKVITKYSKEHRKRRTKAERMILGLLRNRGIKYRSERPFGHYIVDVLIPEKGLVVEIDGSFHKGREKYDEIRTKYLESLGLKVVRITNEQVYSKEVEWLVEFILDAPLQEMNNYKKAYGQAEY